MEFRNFINLLKRHRLTLFLVPIIAIIITYFLTRNQPNIYLSQAKLATGIVDQTQKVFSDEGDAQESKISQEFSNLTEMLRSKKILDQVSYSLIIHDLTNATPYRKPSRLMLQLNEQAKAHALQKFSELYKNRQELSLFNSDQNGLKKVLESMRYDDQSLLNNLTTYRIQTSDYIVVQFESEGSELSSFVVNKLCKEFIDYYTVLLKENQRKAVDFWGTLLKAKQDTLNQRMAALKAYKIKNHVLNLNEKAKSIYAQITDLEAQKETIEKNTQSTQAAINNIDKSFDPRDPRYLEASKIGLTQSYLTTSAQLQTLNNAYVQSNFDPKYKNQIDSLSNVNSAQVQKLSDKNIINPLSTKQSLVDEKLTLQVQHDLAKNSASSVDHELNRLYKEFDNLVPHEGTIQALESAISVASQEYLEILQKYNQTNMVARFSIELRLIEEAEPGISQPSKKMLLVILSGIITFVFCVAVFFILFYFDNTIKNSRELANRTKIPVLGHLNLLKSESIDLREIWNNANAQGETKHFRNLMQSLRYEVDNELTDRKVLLINSIEKGEGKTFIAINLAYAWSTVNKNILLIDGNFSNPAITEFAKTKFYLEDVFSGTIDDTFFSGNGKIKVLGNKGGDISLLEVNTENEIAGKFTALKSAFDLIVIEASSLDTLNKSKEWVNFSDKVLTVFEAGKNISEPINQQIEYLKSLNSKYMGWVLNMEQREHQVTESE